MMDLARAGSFTHALDIQGRRLRYKIDLILFSCYNNGEKSKAENKQHLSNWCKTTVVN